MKSLIIYFSRADENYAVGFVTKGNTEIVADYIQSKTGADMFKVERKIPYAKDYATCIEEAKAEIENDERPEIVKTLDNIDGYDTIYIGSPVYWNVMPQPMVTLLEKLDFSGKTIYPFVTHEGSGLGGIPSQIKKICRGATVKEGIALQGSRVKTSSSAIDKWLKIEKSKVYFTKDISSTGLIKIYEALGRELKGKVAVKISTGEPGGHNFLNPKLIAPLVNKLNGTIVENCTAYSGNRDFAKDHWKAIKDHGFMDIAPCDILDEEGEIIILLDGGTHLKGYDIVGDHIKKYDSMLMLSHFKGHMMGGFGGALKNMSIGVASRNGKAWIHSWGNTTSPQECWGFADNQDAFLESMAEACKAVVTYFKPQNMAYINVANNLSIDCDCDSNPHKPEMADIGIFASLDPVAIDQCCYDTIMNSNDNGKKSLVERMLDRHAIHTVEEACRLGLGSREYEVVNID